MKRWMTMGLVLVALMGVSLESNAAVPASVPLRLWHSYRGAERDALEQVVVDFGRLHPEWPVELLAVPYDAFANKLTSAIPRGNGPDVFIAAHERLGDWAESGLVAPLSGDDGLWGAFFPATVSAVTWKSTPHGYPLAFKSLALFVRDDLIGGSVPADTDAMVATCRGFAKDRPGSFCIAWEAGSFYHHAPWLFGFGGGILDDKGTPVLDRPENAASIAFVRDLTNEGFLPQEPTSALVTQLFNEGRVAMVVNGPWFLGELAQGVPYSVHPLPRVSATGGATTPFLTVDAAMVSARSLQPEAARALARFIAVQGAATRLVDAKQVVALESAFDSPGVTVDPIVLQFRDASALAIPMPNVPVMRAVWEPASQALRSALRGATEPADALKAASKRISIATRPRPAAANPLPAMVGLVIVGIGALIWAARRFRRDDTWSRMRASSHAYAFLAPAAIATAVLVFVPFAVGTGVAFFSHYQGEFTYVGLSNFINILGSTDYAVTDPLSFWFTLAVTIMWTIVNVFLHVSIGVALALALRRPWMKLRGVYRVLLIVPWAVPNYITALIWKGMFHKQFGAINGLLSWIGLEPVSWFSHFWTSFAANVATNTWLGFPFMMVVTLGALQSIPAELEEAAEIDGASAFQRFFSITLPLLKPALLPAVILGGVWTFNMFNIIYLVSAGEPDGATEILITEAYRWAFSRQEQYGYAAAYATLIFLFLLAWSLAAGRLQRRTK
ncbi:MAG TPA: extracellular solute-binding protein [Myxococcota bacterium]|nr:extracellular solute-binding protein [Myxococcota bacterium]